MLKCSLTYVLAVPLAGVALLGCGDDGGSGSGDPDAAQADAMAADAGADAGDGADAGSDHDLTIQSIAGGRIAALAGGDFAGAAHLVRMAEAVRAELYVEGLEPGKDYVAHVHALPCAEDQGGGHYKHDPAIAAELEDNEIWLRFTAGAEGTGVAGVEQLGKIARMDAQSLVVHDPAEDNARIACANLFFDDPDDDPIELQGGFTVDDGAPPADQGIGGSVSVTVSRADGETFVNFDLEGLDQSATYVAQVHVLPCELGAGGHYKRDTTIAEQDQDNEIWPDPEREEQSFPHALRYDAQSIVLHRAEPGATRVACADLVRTTEIPEYVSEGASVLLPAAGSEYEDLEATATLARKRDGTTEAKLEVTGLPEGVTGFGTHVHAGTCERTPPGGPHYKLDPDIAAEIEANEIWLDFDAGEGGEASSSEAKGAHLARPDAISVIIHAPGGDDRLACIDLE